MHYIVSEPRISLISSRRLTSSCDQNLMGVPFIWISDLITSIDWDVSRIYMSIQACILLLLLLLFSNQSSKGHD